MGEPASSATMDASHGRPIERTSTIVHRAAAAVAHVASALIAVVLALVWVVVGLLTDFPTWWQATLYSVTASVTFVMVFVIQHTQSKQVAAMQRKLDELVRASSRASNELISVEEAPHEELDALAADYREHRHAEAAPGGE